MQEFARQTHIQIIFFSRLTEGLEAPGLDGQYTIANALGVLLEGSKLTFRVINPKTIEIRPLAIKSPDGRSGPSFKDLPRVRQAAASVGSLCAAAHGQYRF